MNSLALLIGLLSGFCGGLWVGQIMNSNVGTAGRAITGIVGGTTLAAFAPFIAGIELSLLSGAIFGGVGGTLLTFILGKLMAKR